MKTLHNFLKGFEICGLYNVLRTLTEFLPNFVTDSLFFCLLCNLLSKDKNIFGIIYPSMWLVSIYAFLALFWEKKNFFSVPTNWYAIERAYLIKNFPSENECMERSHITSVLVTLYYEFKAESASWRRAVVSCNSTYRLAIFSLNSSLV